MSICITEIDIEKCVQESIRVFCCSPKSATYRQHARPARKADDKSSKPNVSYYSHDYNEGNKSDLVSTVYTLPALFCATAPRTEFPYFTVYRGIRVFPQNFAEKSVKCR